MTKPPLEPLEYAVPATVVAKKRLPLVTRCVINLLFALGLLCLLIFARTPYDREAYNAQHDLAEVMAIARPKSSSTFYGTYAILGSTNGDSPRSYLRVVRLVPFRAIPYGALYHTSDGLIVGLRYDNFCYLAYDIANQRFYGHGDVEKLSPFLLLNEKSQLHAPDEASILKAMTGGEAMGLPTRETLTAALAHPNAAVRASAANMLKAMGQ